MIPTLYWENDTVMILDQRKLPSKTVFMPCRNMARVIYCIKTLATRGAPAIGVAAAMGLALAAKSIRVKKRDLFLSRFAEQAEIMRAARPTAVNLSWACDRILKLVNESNLDADGLKNLIKAESQRMLEQDIEINKAMGRNGATVVPDEAVIITHCNAGSLATAGYGTALGVIRAAHEAGKKVSVIADETRPLLQGARLTAWEMVQENIPVKVVVDSSSGVLMSRNMVDMCVVGADRIAANGDAANKIGTFNLALVAKRHNVPFYVAAPLSTVDLDTPKGSDIPIEERESVEVTTIGGRLMTPSTAEALNFAFDVTPNDLITGIITEVGVLKPPFNKSLSRAKSGL